MQSRLDAEAPAAAPAASQTEPATELAPKEDYGVHIRGFGELDYKALDQRQAELSSVQRVTVLSRQFVINSYHLHTRF